MEVSKSLFTFTIVTLLITGFVIAGTTGEDENKGAVRGSVEPYDASVTVYVEDSENMLMTVESDPKTGGFILDNLPDGIIRIEIVPSSDGYMKKEVWGVRVASDELLELGTIFLEINNE
jgi:hypothetical protein